MAYFGTLKTLVEALQLETMEDHLPKPFVSPNLGPQTVSKCPQPISVAVFVPCLLAVLFLQLEPCLSSYPAITIGFHIGFKKSAFGLKAKLTFVSGSHRRFVLGQKCIIEAPPYMQTVHPSGPTSLGLLFISLATYIQLGTQHRHTLFCPIAAPESGQ